VGASVESDLLGLSFAISGLRLPTRPIRFLGLGGRDMRHLRSEHSQNVLRDYFGTSCAELCISVLVRSQIQFARASAGISKYLICFG
jgi:hypothetical protein